MKIETIMKTITKMKKSKQISETEAVDLKTLLCKVWSNSKHHNNGEHDGSIFNTIKVNGYLHNLLHGEAYKFIVETDILKGYICWIKNNLDEDLVCLQKDVDKLLTYHSLLQ